ncbi:MAG: hypothetical protein IK954_01000, partial [Clostridia bacterium]|nr:hypothetical protein [Clostridia bacterium]
RKHENHPKTHKTGGAKQFFEKKTVSETTMIASAYWRMTSNQRPYRAVFFQKTVASSARLWYTFAVI